jgi:hypothetical protein
MWSGLLAPSPKFFASTGAIQPLSEGPHQSAPSTSTNVGLHVQFKLAPGPHTDQSLKFALLDCKPYLAGNARFHQVALVLAMLGGDQYARVDSHELASLPVAGNSERLATALLRQDKDRQYVFVKQQARRLYPTITLGNLHGHELQDAYPPEIWHQVMGMIRPSGRHARGIVGGLRFALPRSTEDIIPGYSWHLDVLVRLIPGRAAPAYIMPYDCFYRVPEADETLQRSYVHAITMTHQHREGLKFFRLASGESVHLGYHVQLRGTNDSESDHVVLEFVKPAELDIGRNLPDEYSDSLAVRSLDVLTTESRHEAPPTYSRNPPSFS